MKLSEETDGYQEPDIVKNDNIIKEILGLSEKELSQHQLYYTRKIVSHLAKIRALVVWSFWLVIIYFAIKFIIDLSLVSSLMKLH